MRKNALLLLPLATLLPACTQMQVTRLKHYPSKPATCELTYDYSSPMEAMKWMSGYDQVGTIGVGKSFGKVGDEWTDALKKMVRPDACRLGADVVVMVMTSQSIAGGGASYYLYRKLDGVAAPASPTNTPVAGTTDL